MMVRKAGAVHEKRKKERKGIKREAEKERGRLEGRGKKQGNFQ